MGAVLREQNALPCGAMVKCCLKAKDDVDNVGAGRAAKGEKTSFCIDNRQISSRSLSVFLRFVAIFFLFPAKRKARRS